MKLVMLSLILLLATACPKVEKSAGMALDNAGDAIKTGEDKIWMEPVPEENSVNDDRRY